MSTTTNLTNLKINYLTQAQYDEALANEEISDNEIYLTPAEKVDYVVEQGTSGIWTYRKWNSGLAEAWGHTIVESTTYTANGGSKQVKETIPSAIFTGSPTFVQASGHISTVAQTQIGYTFVDSSYVQTYLINRSGSSITASGGVYWEVKGTWK